AGRRPPGGRRQPLGPGDRAAADPGRRPGARGGDAGERRAAEAPARLRARRSVHARLAGPRTYGRAGVDRRAVRARPDPAPPPVRVPRPGRRHLVERAAARALSAPRAQRSAAAGPRRILPVVVFGNSVACRITFFTRLNG